MQKKRDSILLLENVSVGVAYAILVLLVIWFITSAAPIFGVGKPPQPVIVEIEEETSKASTARNVSVFLKQQVSGPRRFSQLPPAR